MGLEIGTRGPTTSPTGHSSYEQVLQGLWHFFKQTPEAVAQAIACFDRAIAINPLNAEAHRWRASCRLEGWFTHFSRDDLLASFAMVTHAVELDPASARCQSCHGFVRLWVEGVDAAAESYRRALALNPGDPDALTEFGLAKVYAGELAAPHRLFAESSRLNPFPPLWFREFPGVLAFVEGVMRKPGRPSPPSLEPDTSITLLVNNASVGATAPLVAADIEAMEAMIRLNVSALTRLTYAAAPQFVARGTGTIINIASIVAIAPELLNGVYGGSKAFVLALSQSLHHELADKGVRVQAVLPGATATEFWDIAGLPVHQLPAGIVM